MVKHLPNLNHQTLLVTRPEPGNQALCDLIRQCGGTPVSLPCIEIHPHTDSHEAERLAQFNCYQGIIFISQPAATLGLERLTRQALFQPLKNLTCAAIGKATAGILASKGLKPLLPGETFTSESLLELTALHQVAGQYWLIVRGRGGRTTLGDTLKARGAQVDYWEVYERTRLGFTKSELKHKLNPTKLSAIIITSGEILDNLCRLWNDISQTFTASLMEIPIIAPGKRLAELAYSHHFKQVIQANSTHNIDLLTAIP